MHADLIHWLTLCTNLFFEVDERLVLKMESLYLDFPPTQFRHNGVI